MGERTNTKKQSARETALLSLRACQTQGAWSDAQLKAAIRTAGLDRRDAALATTLVYGVLQNLLLCDFWICRLSTVKLEKLEVDVKNAIRLGMYQMAFLTRIPTSAAVNESVNLAKRYSRNPNSPRLVNGILRSFSRQREDGSLPVPQGTSMDDLSLRYSHPKWLVELLNCELGGEGLEELLAAHNGKPPMTAQINTVKTTAEQVQEELRGLAVTAELHPWLPDCLILSGTGDLEELPPFQRGDLMIQDAAARLAAMAAGLHGGERVLDACAAPGGKSFAAAIAMKDRGQIISCDIHKNKIRLIESGAKRLALSSIQAMQADGKQFRPEWEHAFDCVIADVPCSGLGIIRKKPDIRYKEPEALNALPKIQRAILENVSRYVKPGGVLIYSTCTVLRRENQDVLTDFLDAHSEFSAETLELPQPVGRCPEGYVTLWSHIHGTDGFFISKLRRSL